MSDFFIDFVSTIIPGANVRCGVDSVEASSGCWGRMNAGFEVASVAINGVDMGQHLTNDTLALLDKEALAAVDALSIRKRISYADWQAMCERIAVEMQDEVAA